MTNNLYTINADIQQLLDTSVDPETGEFLLEDGAVEKFAELLSRLTIERADALADLAKEVLSLRAQMAAAKDEETRLRNRRMALERSEKRLMTVLEHECGGEKTDLGVATVSYRKSELTEVTDEKAAVKWLIENGYDENFDDGYVNHAEPTVCKTKVKQLIKSGKQVDGVTIVPHVTCSLK